MERILAYAVGRVSGETVRRLLQAEFLAFYLAIPLLMAVAMPPAYLFPALFAFTILGAFLLQITPGFRWRDLVTGFSRIDWGFVGGFALVTVAAATGFILLLRPEAFLVLARDKPDLLAMIWVFYPWFSALPQELIFRPLFFRRYGGLMPSRRLAILFNGALFSFAHLMYWNLPALVLTFAGGVAFAWAYEKQRNFPAAVLMHALAGGILFSLGLGVWFFTGNIVRPF
ncbi:MAG: CPBP family intramembrane metalloprotease [Alphaproteobacteria bacterium HGW-Alphaproteobacteria-2]|nr:MAG: CPBP family intramembrane metalloprotease [Alphaproteobacteria bacterium HGW-Alphaproteobacteria-2]